jgi:stage V sporulation protein AD
VFLEDKMRKIIDFSNHTPSFLSFSSAGGYEERRGPLGDKFDISSKDDRFGMQTWESAEGEMARLCLNLSLKKANLVSDDIDVLFAGDLENQCVATASGLYTFGIPYVGLYSACSTLTEGLLLLSSLLSKGDFQRGAVVTSSHNSAAERQFRTPVEYGGQRTPSAQWTATAAGAFVLGFGGKVKIMDAMPGKIVDGLTLDGSDMGSAMARSAFDTIYTYLSLKGHRDGIELIVTGDLGVYGSEILKELLAKEGVFPAENHIDCGTLLYDKKEKDPHAGASGCGCSAAVLANYFLPRLESGNLSEILFLSTGALMSPSSLLQKQNILGLTPLIRLISRS